jgi:hypothetical protein
MSRSLCYTIANELFVAYRNPDEFAILHQIMLSESGFFVSYAIRIAGWLDPTAASTEE